jgi:hypothetical protein
MVFNSKFAHRSAILLALVICGIFVYGAEKEILSRRQVQLLISKAGGLDLSQNAVEIKELSASGSKALVVARIETAFRLEKETDGEWRVAEVRVGDRQWEDLDLIVRAINNQKSLRARDELRRLAAALESFRRDRGFYVTSKELRVLTDHITPIYLRELIRVDPWHEEYRYEGTAGNFQLRSAGPDKRLNTADDIIEGDSKTLNSAGSLAVE